MADRSILVRLRANIDDYRRGMDNASDLTRRQSDAMNKLGKAGLAMGAAMAVGAALSVKAAIEWETAWAGVTKTVDGSAEQMAVLEQDLRKLATTLPASHKEIAAVAEAAGQLGVKREDIKAFTETMIHLGETTNLTSDEAATTLARFMNIMGTAGDDVDRLGAALVELGNNGASTEAEIAAMGLRIAGAGRQIGLTEGEVLGFANALSSVGIEAEAGGSAFSRVLIDIATAVDAGGVKLDDFAGVAGVTAEEYATAFRDDAAGATNMFIDGLGRMSASGESTFQMLDKLELSEIRTRDALLRLSNATGMSAESTAMGNEAWAANTALLDEANKRYETNASKISVMKNNINELAIDLGDQLLPAFAAGVEAITALAAVAAGLPGEVQAGIVAVGVLGTAVTVVGSVALIAVPKILGLQAQLVGLGISAGTAAGTIRVLGTTLKFAGIASALLAVGAALAVFGQSSDDAVVPVDKLVDQVREFALQGKLTGDAADLLGANFDKLRDSFDRAGFVPIDPDEREQFYKDTKEIEEQTLALDDALAQLVSSGHGDQATSFFERMQQAAQAQGYSLEELGKKFPDYYDAMNRAGLEGKTSAAATYEAAGALTGLDAALGTAYDSLGAYAEAQGLLEDGTKDLIKQTEGWADSLAGAVDPLGAYTDLLGEKEEAEQATAEATAAATASTTDSWEDFATGVEVSMAEYLDALEKQVEAQANWAGNLGLLAGKVSEEVLGILVGMGIEAAPLIAKMVDSSVEEFERLNKFAPKSTQDAMLGSAEQLRLAVPLFAQLGGKIGADTVAGLARELAAGTTTVAQIARAYAYELGAGIAPMLQALGHSPAAIRSLISQERAQGNRQRRAAGGLLVGPGTDTADGPAFTSTLWPLEQTP